jgi:hypothetical protein
MRFEKHEMKRKLIYQELAALILLAGIALLFFWPVWVAGYTFPQGGGDLFGQLYYVWSYVGNWLRQGVLALWNTQMMAGDPIIAEAQYGLLNPLNWPLFLFSPIPRGALLLRAGFTLWLAGAGLYLYLRHSPVWRLSRAAALVAGVAYMCSNPFITHLGHPQFNDVMAWLPWVLWGIDGAARQARAIPWAVAAIALLLLAGHGQAALYAALAAACYALWQILEGWRAHALQRTGRLALTALLGAALAMPALLPGLERLPLSDRALVPQEERHGYEFPAEMLVDFLNPNFHGQGVHQFWAPWDRVESGYAGAITLYLALLGVLAGIRQRRVWFLVGLGLFAYLFALGYQGPLYARLAPLPLFAESWKTARIVFLLSLALAIGAGLGIEALRQRSRLRHGWSLLVVVFGAALWFLAPGWAAAAPATEAALRALTGLRFAAVLAGATALLGALSARQFKLASAALLLLLAAELSTAQSFAETDPPAPIEDAHAEARAFLRADTGWFRVDVDAVALGLWSPAQLMAEGFAVPQGAGNPMELFSYNQFYWAVPYKDSPAYQLLGAKYIVMPKGGMPGGAGIWPVYTDSPYIELHLNTNALPRAWLVTNTVPVANIEEAYSIIFDPEFAPAQLATVTDGPTLQGEGAGKIEVLAYGPNRAVFQVESSVPALFVLSDILYPGWKARLDGETTPIYRTNGIFRGIVVPADSHRIEMRFAPASLMLGLGLAASALIILVVLWHNCQAGAWRFKGNGERSPREIHQ